jgi:putative IMPACT (imprinted ancient) family translation regulator
MAEDRKPFQKGRPSKAYREGLSWLLRTAFTEEDRMEVIQMLVRRAKAEDLEATKILLAYTFGKPKEYHEHSGGVLIRIVDDSDSKGTENLPAIAALEAGDDSDDEGEEGRD